MAEIEIKEGTRSKATLDPYIPEEKKVKNVGIKSSLKKIEGQDRMSLTQLEE